MIAPPSCVSWLRIRKLMQKLCDIFNDDETPENRISPSAHWFEKGVILTKWRQLVLSTYEIPGKKKRVNFKFTKKSLTRNQCAEGEMWFSGVFKRNLSSHKSSSSGINWKSPIMNIVIWCKVESKYAAETSPGILGIYNHKWFQGQFHNIIIYNGCVNTTNICSNKLWYKRYQLSKINA